MSLITSHVSRNGNGAGLGWVAPIPTLPRLLKTMPILVPFKKLNGAGMGNSQTHPTLPRLAFFFKITFKIFNYIKINIFYK